MSAGSTTDRASATARSASDLGGFSAEAWHADAIGDSGVSHTRVGRRYVVACQWCRCVFIAGTATAAMRSFRDHEAEMLEGSRE